MKITRQKEKSPSHIQNPHIYNTDLLGGFCEDGGGEGTTLHDFQG